ncbi:MAG: Maf family protein [Rhodothermales bacterium]
MILSTPFILASASPRRRDLLRVFGFPFEVIPSSTAEVHVPGETPDSLVRRLASEKAREVSYSHEDALVLGADTVVVLDGAILGKPEDADDARAMLARLSGRTHVVYTGIALEHGRSRRSVSHASRTHVTMDVLSPDEIADYVSGGSPMDKAGAYGIQEDRGAMFVAGIEGDYYTVVGLPLNALYRILLRDFADLIVRASP